MDCNRCGIQLTEAAIEKRKSRGTYDGLCFDCRSSKAIYLQYDGEICRAWHGDVDDDFNPIDKKLKLYLPGIRTCGHKDCVNKSHIIPPAQEARDIELERHDISYRTGKRTEWADLLKELPNAHV